MRIRSLNLCLIFPVLALAFVCAGCAGSGTTPDRPVATLPAKGKVTYKGKPLTKGTVHFEPEFGRPAQGDIQPDGSFSLMTYTAGDGAVPGSHRVSVSGLNKAVLPAKFGSANTSGIEIEVAKDKAEYNITLN